MAVTIRTVMLVHNQRIFEAPCLEDMDGLVYEYKRRKRSETDEYGNQGQGTETVV